MSGKLKFAALDNWDTHLELDKERIINELAAQIQKENPGMFSKGMSLGAAVDADGLSSVILQEVQKRKDILPEETEEIVQAIFGQASGYGPLAPFFIGDYNGVKAEGVTEIQVNASKDRDVKSIFYVVNGEPVYAGNHFFKNDEELLRFIQMHCGKAGVSFNEENPKVDAWLPDGSRLHALGFKTSPFGTLCNIRKSPVSRQPVTLEMMVENGTFPQLFYDMSVDLLVKGQSKLGIYGPTDSGKTADLRAMGRFIDRKDRTVIAERSFELFWDHLENCVNIVVVKVSGQEIVGMYDLCDSINRNNAKRVVISEVLNGKEMVAASSIFESTPGSVWITGHAGGLQELRSRIRNMFYQGGIPLTMEEVDTQIRTMHHFIIFKDYNEVHKKRMLMEFVEVTPNGYNTIIEFDKATFAETGEIQWIYKNTITPERLGALAFRGASIKPEYMNMPGRILKPGWGVKPSDSN